VLGTGIHSDGFSILGMSAGFFTPCYIAGAVSGEVMTINKQTLVIE
jgi:hypothetical protein